MDILSQFGVQPILLAAQVVNFLILLFILKKLLYKPILKVLEERKKRIEESLKNAEEIEKKLHQTDEQVDRILKKTLDEAQKVINESKEGAAQIIEAGQKTAAEIIQKAESDVIKIKQTQKVKLEQEVMEHLADIVTLALEKVIGRKITKKEQLEIIEKEVKNIS